MFSLLYQKQHSTLFLQDNFSIITITKNNSMQPMRPSLFLLFLGFFCSFFFFFLLVLTLECSWLTLISFITIVINLLLVNFFIVNSIFDFINRNTAINEELSPLDHRRCFPALIRSGTLCSWIVFLSCTIIPKKQMTSARLTRLTSAWFFLFN